jgi:hypothetical protein
MESKCASYLTRFAIFWFVSLVASQGSAQVSIESHIDGLVRDSEKDGTSSSFAQLVKIGKPALGPLIERLKTTKYCDFKYEAARVIWRIEPKHEILNQLLFDTASANCEYRYPPEKYLPHVNMSSIMAQWYSARSLAEYQEGGIVLVAKLPEKPAGIYAFFHAVPAITTVLGKYDRGELRVDTEVIAALKRAIPHLAKWLDVDRTRTRCDVWDILTFFQNLKNKELSVAAEDALRGKSRAGCETAPANSKPPNTRPLPRPRTN